eukprot:TRINITY_DN5117_c0_g1_i2.p1 TRINITY_DN5117_c0_g1~~TRINITY_DN5117_c0_g1_i2.p1  ORF type:complete len:488 (-),score=70.16 TRINITY_DN5117_c0_g1_i2:328-1791(-)
MGSYRKEEFKVRLLSEEGSSGSGDLVTVEVSVNNGVRVLLGEGGRSLKSFPLKTISNWSKRGNELVIYTKTVVDIEERQTTFVGDSQTISYFLDFLTGTMLQWQELEEAKEYMKEIKEHKKKKSVLPSASEVEFWNDPEKSGWMMSQGDVVKTWRRRWFVLKSGYLFRFLSPDVDHSSKPRGIVDLSKVVDVQDGRSATNKQNTLKLSQASGQFVCYICDNETEQVEWLSALENAVQRVVKKVAGIEDDKGISSKNVRESHWTDQIDKGGFNFDQGSSASKFSRRLPTSSTAPDPSSGAVFKVVGDSNSRSSAPSSANSTFTVTVPTRGGSGSLYPDATRFTPAQVPPTNQVVTVNYTPNTNGTQPQQSPQRPWTPPHQPQSPFGQQYSPTAAFQQQQLSQNQYQQQQQQQQQQPMSFLDQMPAQAPMYGAPFVSVTREPTAPQQMPTSPLPAGWQVYYTQDGKAYYYNQMTGVTQWDPPQESMMVS